MNTRKGIRLAVTALIGYPLWLASFLFPRTKKKWLFGCRTGFMDNPKYMFLEAITDNKIRCFWMARTLQEYKSVKALHLPVYYRFSLAGLYHCLTAKYYVFSHYVSDINFWTSGNVRQIMLWHGVGIKKIGILNSRHQILKRLLVPDFYTHPYYFLVTSPLMDRHFRHYLKLPSTCIVYATYPRNRILSESKNKLKEFIQTYDKRLDALLCTVHTNAKLYLYMPTFRDTDTDFISDAGFDFKRLNELLEYQQAYFLMKLHPFTRLKDNFKSYSRIRFIEGNVDIYPLLPFIDTLITDYSSIYYDFILLKGKTVILFPFDYKEYMIHCRDFAYDYDTYTPGARAYSFEELLNVMKDKKGSSTDDDSICQIRKIFWSTNDSFYEKICR